MIDSGGTGRTDASSSVPTFAPRPLAQVGAVEGEQVEDDEGVFAIRLADALERVPAIGVVGDDLAVEDDVVIGRRRHRRRQPAPLRQLRLARRADRVDVVADAAHEHAVAVPLRLVHPDVADRHDSAVTAFIGAIGHCIGVSRRLLSG